MAKSANGLQSQIEELLCDVGTVKLRRVFGNDGMVLNNVLLGMSIDGRLYVRTDAQTRRAYVAERSAPFAFIKKAGERIVTSYYAIPDRLFDEPDELRAWLLAAYEAALISPTAIKRRRLRHRKDGKLPKRRLR